MTSPTELADEIEAMDQFGSRAADRALLAAAIRGMEAILNAPDSQAPDHVWGDYIRAREAALTDYRSARQRLAGIAP